MGKKLAYCRHHEVYFFGWDKVGLIRVDFGMPLCIGIITTSKNIEEKFLWILKSLILKGSLRNGRYFLRNSKIFLAVFFQETMERNRRFEGKKRERLTLI